MDVDEAGWTNGGEDQDEGDGHDDDEDEDEDEDNDDAPASCLIYSAFLKPSFTRTDHSAAGASDGRKP
jgi:hypothetical protein